MKLLTDEKITKALPTMFDGSLSISKYDTEITRCRAIAKAQAELTITQVDKLLKDILKIQVGATKTGDDCYEIKPYWRGYLRKQLRREIAES